MDAWQAGPKSPKSQGPVRSEDVDSQLVDDGWRVLHGLSVHVDEYGVERWRLK